MSWISEAWPWLCAMAVLICFSALFSGSEAALFSLSNRERKRLRRAGPGGRLAYDLLDLPERLLSAILFWNLLINMIYFAIAAIVGGRLEADESTGASGALLFTFASLMTIIFFSEMLPKSFAVLSPVRISALVGVPLAFAVRIVGPVLPVVTKTNLVVGRLIWPGFQPEPEIDLTDIERAIELGTDDAVLLQRERMALRGLVEMAETRVSELMRPRNRLWTCSDLSDANQVLSEMPERSYLMVTNPAGDTILRSIGVRSLRPSRLDDLASAGEPVIYVPWSAFVSQVMDRLKEEDRAVAVVVNEFGELAGAVSIDDILRFVLSPRGDEEQSGALRIREIGPDQFRVLGSVSIRRLGKQLGIEVSDEGITTVAGFIQKQCGRFLRTGDSARLNDYVLSVLEETDEGWEIDVCRLEDEEGGEA